MKWKTKNAEAKLQRFYFVIIQLKLSSLNQTGLQTRSTYMHGLDGAVVIHLNGLHIGLPHLVGFSIRMTHIVAEMNTFFTDITLCHYATPPSDLIRPHVTATHNAYTIADLTRKIKQKF